MSRAKFEYRKDREAGKPVTEKTNPLIFLLWQKWRKPNDDGAIKVGDFAIARLDGIRVNLTIKSVADATCTAEVDGFYNNENEVSGIRMGQSVAINKGQLFSVARMHL